jgi:hypothetical protein
VTPFEVLRALAADLGDDEVRVLVLVGRRLLMGQRSYGPLDVRGDARDWRAEAAEELLDATVYLARDAMRRERGEP